MKYIWAIGLFAAGQSSTMTGTYTGQFVMSGFMELRVSPFKRALITRSVALFPTLAFAIAYAGTNEMDTINQDLNVLQSFQLPFALIPVLYISTRDDVMGAFNTRFIYKWVVQAVCGLLLVLNMTTAVLATRAGMHSVAVGAAIVLCLALYFLFVVYLLIGPIAVQAFIDRTRSPVAKVCLGWLGRGPRPVEPDVRYNSLRSGTLDHFTITEGAEVDAPLSPTARQKGRPIESLDEG
jgi:Natural resistance-associated macrophage protein